MRTAPAPTPSRTFGALALAGLLTGVLAAPAATASARGEAEPAAVAESPVVNGKIAFTSNRDGNYEIYVMDADGTNPTRLTTSPGNDTFPAFSSDGTKIAFHSTRDGNGEIYVMDAEGGNPTRLTTDTAVDVWPSWGAAAVPGDTVPPVLSAPQTVTATATSINGAVVTFEVTATADVDGDVPVTCEPASGDLFPWVTRR